MNEFSSVLQVYKTDQAKNCAADNNGEVYESKEFLDEYEWTLVSQLDAAIRLVGPFIATMEASEKVTCSLVIPMTLAIFMLQAKMFPYYAILMSMENYRSLLSIMRIFVKM